MTSPKSEVRSPKEDRNPKRLSANYANLRELSDQIRGNSRNSRISPSALFRISDFGFRISARMEALEWRGTMFAFWLRSCRHDFKLASHSTPAKPLSAPGDRVAQSWLYFLPVSGKTPAMKRSLLFTAAILTCATVLAEDAAKSSNACDQLGWQLAVHAYTFRKFTLGECIDKTASLGLKYMSLSGSVNLATNKTVKTVEMSERGPRCYSAEDKSRRPQAGQHRRRPTAPQRGPEPQSVRVRQEGGH